MSYRRFLRKYKHVLLIAVVMLSAIGIVSVLTAAALRPVNQKNGFNRKVLTPLASVVSAIEKPAEVFDIAGTYNESIYFKTRWPGKLFITDLALGNQRALTLNLPANKKLASIFYHFIEDSSNFKILAGNMPAIITAHASLPGKGRRFPAGVFTRAVRISEHSYVFRGFDSTRRTPDQIFVKGDARIGVTAREHNISELNGDAGVSTDGLLHYDSTTNQLLYIYFYRNEILCLDTNLNLLSKRHTIDVNSDFTTTGGQLSKNGKATFTNTAPRRMINWTNCVYKGMLFNNSRLKGDNETDNDFKNGSAIDVYDVATGKYKGSFYIPRYKEEKMRQFNIVNDRLIAIYKNHIATYEIPATFATEHY